MLKTPVRIACAIAMLALAGTGVSASRIAQSHPPQPPTIVERFLEPDRMPLVSYRAFRRLTASTRGGRLQASVDAWTTLDPANGFSYEVTAESGSPIIRRRVLLAALEAEQKAVNSPDAGRAALTPANYDFLAVSHDGTNLTKVDVRPRRKHVMLIDGSLFLAPDSADLVRVEGELSARPSFWTRRVRVVREYARVEGVHVPVAMQSTADVLVVGASSFSMTYAYSEINGRRVDSK